MGTADLTHKGVSKTPIYAPKGYKKYKDVELVDDKYKSQYAGKGIKLSGHPCYNSCCIKYPKDEDKCNNCGSNNTLCIYFEYYADLVGKEAIYELECRDCGMFSSYHFFD